MLDKILAKVENTIIVGALLSSVLALMVNIVLRYIFKSGLIWAEEYARFAIVWLTFIGASVVIREGEHLSVGIVMELLKNRKAKVFVEKTGILLALLFSVFLIVFGGQLTVETYKLGQVSPSLQLPMWTVYSAVPMGGLLTSYRFIQLLRRKT
ncbi:TRAP transporter small permease [Fusibacter bizertensis]|uniref:TRAP transporter small permease n=1 Tax=Fusibacter bizertensis TaxID=1488331 RepID=A0ABT6NBL6_9FIRM|nr:TRAP transporter small permease [Fusibacter bizertensis]MDH8677812.1 TRAP transporter small permease [Fusibacter bizertensis]